MHKGKAPAFPSSPPSPPRDIGTSMSRDRSRSPPPHHRTTTTTAITVIVPPPQREWPCDLCRSVFTTEHGLRGHLNIHSRPPTDSTAQEAWDAILEAHQGNPPPALAELFRPQLEHDLNKQVGAATVPGRRGTTVITGVPIANPNIDAPALPPPMVPTVMAEAGPSGSGKDDKAGDQAGSSALAASRRVIDLNVSPPTSSEEENDKQKGE